MHEIEQKAQDNPSPWARKHIQQYIESDGQEVEHPSADRLILLHHKGRKSGTVYRTPLVHFADGDDMLIIASKGGAPDHPQWFHNLEADPQVWVRYKDEFFEARAEVLDPETREPVWDRITSHTPAFAEYQEKAGRVIPVVRLRRGSSETT